MCYTLRLVLVPRLPPRVPDQGLLPDEPTRGLSLTITMIMMKDTLTTEGSHAHRSEETVLLSDEHGLHAIACVQLGE